MASDLVPLDEFNARQRDAWDRAVSNAPRPNGIACPTCGCELVDSNPNATLTSSPPQKAIHCPACEWKGLRIA